MDKFEPKEEKKLPKVSIDSQSRSLETTTDNKLANATSSQPDKLFKNEEIHKKSMIPPLLVMSKHIY